MPFDPADIASNLQQDEQGIWRAGKCAPISYSTEHHDRCFGVEEKSFWFRHRARCIIQVIRNFPPNDAILDLGGGNGFMTHAMSKSGFPSILMEPGENGIRNAAKRGLEPLICSTLDGAGFPENSIPAISVFDVIEHINDDVDFLDSIERHLRPGGKLYLTVPAYKLLWSTADVDAGHYHRYTLRSIGSKLRATRFDILYETYIFSVLPLPSFIMRALPYRLGLRPRATTRTREKEHGANLKKMSEYVDKLFGWELTLLKRHKMIPFGGSCLMVAVAKK